MAALPSDLLAPVVRDGASGIQLCLHPGQEQAWDSEARFVFVIAGTQSGKTSFGPWWLRREIARRGPGDYLAVTATYDLFKLKMLPEMKRTFCGLLVNEGWQWQASDRLIVSGDTRIVLRSAEADGGLESLTGKAAWLDECGQDRFRLEAWEAVQRRMSLEQGRVLGTTTPYNLGWLKLEVFDRWRSGDPSFQVVQFKSTMNPRFPKEEYLRTKATMAGWKHAMFYDGEFTRPAGLIYSDFSDSENVVDDFRIPPEWVRRVGVDFGAVNTCTLWTAEDPESHLIYVYLVTLEGGKTTKEHCRLAKERAAGTNVVAWVGGAPSETQQRSDWTAEGVRVGRPRIVDVEAGIDRVIELVKPRRLKVFRSQRGLLDEIGTYSRVLNDRGEPTEKIKDKETFHRLDAKRYVCSLITARPPREAQSYKA